MTIHLMVLRTCIIKTKILAFLPCEKRGEVPGYEQGRGFLSRSNHAGTMILDFPASITIRTLQILILELASSRW